MFQPWRIDDFVPTPVHARGPVDFWEPQSGSQSADDPLAVALRPSDFWEPIDNSLPPSTTMGTADFQSTDFWDPLPLPQEAVARSVVDWSDGLSLPLFQKGASENPFVFEDDLPSKETIGRRRARWLASLLDIPSSQARRAFADRFEELFDEFPHHQTFRVLSDLALEGTSADEIVTAYQLRLVWADHPQFWSIRRKGFRGSFVPDGGDRLLGWTRAVCLANLAKGLPAERIFDEDWFDEWLKLPFGDPLYWSFLEYATARLESFSLGVLAVPDMLARMDEPRGHEPGAHYIDGMRLGSFARTGMLVRLETDALAYSHLNNTDGEKPAPRRAPAA